MSLIWKKQKNVMTEPEIDWHLMTWDGAREEQMRRWALLDWNQILRAQEEMAELAKALGHDPYADSPFKKNGTSKSE